MDVSKLKEKIVDLEILDYDDHQIFVHEVHRLTLSIVKIAQAQGVLPTPCTLIMFDFHNDLKSILNISKLDSIKESISLLDFIEYCKNDLSTANDDWVKAGFELGIFDDLIIFGLDSEQTIKYSSYSDSKKRNHNIKAFECLPYDLLGSRDDLCDIAHYEDNLDLFKILDWGKIPNNGFGFLSDNIKFCLSIDLDCFTIHHKDMIIPWHDNLFKNKFFDMNCLGWSGYNFIQKLLTKTGIISIAREPIHLGSKENEKEILSQVNKYLFNSQLNGITQA